MQTLQGRHYTQAGRQKHSHVWMYSQKYTPRLRETKVGGSRDRDIHYERKKERGSCIHKDTFRKRHPQRQETQKIGTYTQRETNIYT